MNATTEDAQAATASEQHQARSLRRSGDDRMLAGVAGGIARYLDTDVTLVRVIMAALVLFTGAGAAALYVAAWLLIPADGDDQSIASAWIARCQDRFR
jgi:phage shock protein PspC (stress-responsive transcriptional regulator)